MTQIGDNPQQNTPPPELEERKLSIQIKQIELEIRRAELEKAKIDTSTKLNWSFIIPALATVVAALVAFLSNNYLAKQDRDKLLAVERAKLQSSLLISAVTTGDEQIAQKNLKLFLKYRLIDDPDGVIAKLTEQGQTPVLPVRSGSLGDIIQRDCKGEGRRAFTSTEIHQEGAALYIESCAYSFGDAYIYIYQIQNKGERDVFFAWDHVSLFVSVSNPLRPGKSLLYSTANNGPPSVSETEIQIGPSGAKATVKAILPRIGG